MIEPVRPAAGARRVAVRRPDLLALGGVTLLAAALRFPTLGKQSFWLDEAYTERLVHTSFGGMLHTIPSTESTPPLYYVLAWLWTRLFGASEFAIRSLSALAGVLTVLVAYELGRRCFNRRTGILAALLVAASPLLVWFSQEARSYALATLFATLTVLCFMAFREDGGWNWLAGWAISAAVGVATHYFVVFVVVPEIVWLLIRRRDLRVVGATAVVGVSIAALVPLALAQRGTGHADYISHGSLATRLLQIPKQFLVGYASPSQVVTATLAALILASVVAAVTLTRSWGKDRSLWLLLAIGLAGVLCPILLAFAGVDFVNTRNMLPALPTLLVVIAAAFDRLRARAGPLLAVALAAVLVVVVVLVDTQPRFERDNWRGASRAIGPVLEPRALLLRPAEGLIVLRLYQHEFTRLTSPVRIGEIDVLVTPPHLPGEGIGRVPRFDLHRLVPAGFAPAGRTATDTFETSRFRTSQPIVVTPATFAVAKGRGFAVVVQVPAR